MSIEKKLTILVVEDQDFDYMLIERSIKALEKSDVKYELHWVRDGEEALDFLFRRGKYASAPRPNLILLDLNLPKKNGLEVLEEIKKDEKLRKIPVVVLTVSESEEDMVRAYDSGASGYLQKPTHVEDFEKLLQTVWEYWRIVRLPE
ncbi:MAG TPA: response regulator [Candidatus Acetothermia bacterium]|nr:response regulator [Candidatus Acetothermia bacterium]